MRIAVGQAARPTHEYLAFARQIGAAGVQFNTPDLPGERRWEAADLVALRERVESYGLRLEAIENLPNSFYASAMFGLPGPGRGDRERHRHRREHGPGRHPHPRLPLAAAVRLADGGRPRGPGRRGRVGLRPGPGAQPGRAGDV